MFLVVHCRLLKGPVWDFRSMTNGGCRASKSSPQLAIPVVNLIKHFTIVIYDSRVARLENAPNYDSRIVIYTRKMFIRLATDGLINQTGKLGRILVLCYCVEHKL